LSYVTPNNITHCWICEKWVPVEYELEAEVKGRKIKSNINADDFVKGKKMKLIFESKKIEDPVFIHFQWDKYKPWYIKEENKKWKIKVMTPPGQWNFFFTSGLSDAVVSSSHELSKSKPFNFNC